ncbi:MAG TPA: cytochrome C oxidase subunit IV family protein [Anaeromyxobacteraceae bacterium]|nr:cytochrome C oxidase subunit IV family protein [Anaeromyxobacteraceae bacterium]
MDTARARERAETGAGTLVGVWATLLALTGVLVAANHYAPGNPGIVAVMVITPVKAALVGWHFMHLREEGRAVRIMLFAAMAVVVVFIGLMMLDYGFR